MNNQNFQDCDSSDANSKKKNPQSWFNDLNSPQNLGDF